MKQLTADLTQNLTALQKQLTAEDILTFPFCLADKTACAVLFADGVTDKNLLGEQVIRPLQHAEKAPFATLLQCLSCPECKQETELSALVSSVLGGDPILLVDGSETAAVLGVKSVPARAITEPQTDIVIRGPRAGFIEELKTNMGLVRSRMKSKDLQFSTRSVGKQSNTTVAVCYLDGIADSKIVKKIERKLDKIDTDGIPDSSYIAKFLDERSFSLFKQVGTTEKPDIFCAKLLEGRVGILVDGSPVALSLPYLLLEDFQTSEDYFVTSYRATFTRLLRCIVILLAVYSPALYVAAQLFKLQLLPLGLLLTIASSIQGLPLSPSLELFITLMLLEILNEASIRMPKYVGLALSVVGALVLGDTAVKAGILSTPAVILIAFSGIGLYTVPAILETTSILRLLFLIVAGSIGPYGIVVFTAFLIAYLLQADCYGAPYLAPFAPLVRKDLKDSLWKRNLFAQTTRPNSFPNRNKTRMRHD